jgi:hypothetical protein
MLAMTIHAAGPRDVTFLEQRIALPKLTMTIFARTAGGQMNNGQSLAGPSLAAETAAPVVSLY